MLARTNYWATRLVSYLLVEENDLADTFESVRRSGRMRRKILHAASERMIKMANELGLD